MKTRLIAMGTVAGVAAMAILLIVVLGFGQKKVPSFPSLEKNPDPSIPGEILFVDVDGCIIRAAASGASREKVVCGHVEGVQWIDATQIRYWDMKRPDPSVRVRDLATGKESAGASTDYRFAASPLASTGDRAISGPEGITIQEADGDLRTLIEYDGPESRWPSFASWSPDGRWLLIGMPSRDYGRRTLWLFSADGTVKREFARDVQPAAPSWYIEGVGVAP